MIELIAERFNFVIVIILMMTGLYAVVATGNLVKRLVGLSLFQTSVFLLYITLGNVTGGAPPIFPMDAGHGGDTGDHGDVVGYGGDVVAHAAEPLYSNPLPHVLILTAIVVGVATLAVGLALVVRIRESYGTIEDEAINRADYAVDSGEKSA